MADSNSTCGEGRGNSGLTSNEALEASLALDRAAALVELLRHHEESNLLTDALLRDTLAGKLKLPEGCTWPGDIEESVVTTALLSVWSEISEAKTALAKAG